MSADCDDVGMGTCERAVDRGRRLSRRLLATLAAEARAARIDRNLSLRAVAEGLGVSRTTVWRFEHGQSPRATLAFVAELFAVVGLDLSARGYPGGTPIRDAPQRDVLSLFLDQVHESVRRGREVPLPMPGDQRRWDAFLRGVGWKYGVEAETGPTDGQALAGRLMLKLRDGAVDGILLVLPATQRVTHFLAAAASILAPLFPIPGAQALEALRRGEDPGGSAIVVLRRSGRAVGTVRFTPRDST